ncbi:MAG: NAD-dependent epimerase/dehydratase family protein [Aphanocapsa sp. GSE-SYN-MK-11-07L]|jgi:nucleoside-diphosphate-sugar epimerase|nr:NAD-dependent epimerase/dehydratase family protein [Aphanocapsa sp. GSE-SYN-MK-11-07L]
MSSAQILVTGATGFIGRYLLKGLVVRGLPLRIALRQTVADHLPLGVETAIVGEINGLTNWQSALSGIQSVVHLAGRAHVLNDDPKTAAAKFTQTNVEGTANLVRQCLESEVQRFIFLSSIGAMGTTCKQRLTELSVCQPDTRYGWSKLQAERAIAELTQPSQMQHTIIRPPLVYGPKNPGNMERLLKLIDRGLPLPFGSVRNQRSFIYVENLVDAIIACLDHPNALGQTFLVSDSSALSTPELIRILATGLGKSPVLFPCPPSFLRLLGQLTGRSGMIDRLLGSLAINDQKFRNLLGWQPPYPVTQGLQATADWYRQTQQTLS